MTIPLRGLGVLLALALPATAQTGLAASLDHRGLGFTNQGTGVSGTPVGFTVPRPVQAGAAGDASAPFIPAAETTTAASLADVVSRGLPITPQMLGAACDSNGTAGNGHDDTAAIQAAVDAAIALGATLRIPGNTTMCRTTAPITIIDRITIDGDYCKPYTDLTQLHPTPGPGSWLFFDHRGAGLFTNGHNPSGMVFKNFCTIRPQPAFVAAGRWSPMAADFDFSIAGDDSHFEHLMILNPTKAIFIQGRSTMRDVRGNPYRIGIQASADEDILRIEDTHFWPFDAINKAAATYQRANLEALQLYRVDNPMISNFFSIGARRCVHFMANSFGRTSKAKFENLDCDLFGEVAILADTDNVTAQFDNVTAQGYGPWDQPSSPTSAKNTVQIDARNVHFTFDNVRSTNTGGDGFTASGPGTWVLLHNYVAEKWGLTTTACAVSANDGATVYVDPSFYDDTGTYGHCIYGGNGMVKSYAVTKVN